MPSAHHVGLTVTDLDRAVAFYEETFDFPTLARFSVSGEAFETAVDVPGATGRFAHLDAGGTRLELVEYDPEGEAVRADRIHQPGATHFGVEVEDVDAIYERLDAAGVETLSEPQTTETGTRICFLRDPEGNIVEVLEL